MNNKRYTIQLGLNYEIEDIIDHCKQDKHLSVHEFMIQINEQDKAYKKLKKENEQLKKENQGIQDKVMRLLDYVEIKQCVTRIEIKKWWNGDVE